jgi:hypothetical protein
VVLVLAGCEYWDGHRRDLNSYRAQYRSEARRRCRASAVRGRFGPLSSRVEAITGGGGRDVNFAHPTGLARNRAGLDQAIDLRGDGGYIVAPP